MKQVNIILFMLSFGIVTSLDAQFCSGNLGENIFTEGDFGTGSQNIITIDPNIAPGFNYNPVAPPYDGDYIITNDISQWAYSFNWLTPKDNSDDPNGYMMVVNASFEPGLFYEKEVNGLCANTLYEFSADVINLLPPGSNGLKPNVSFLLDDMSMINTGSIPEDAEWHSYGFTFTTGPAQTSVTLSLRNNAPGGQGNDLALDNISFRACGPEAQILPEDTEYLCLDGDPINLDATVNGDQYPDPAFQWQQSFDEGLTWVDMAGETSLFITHDDFTSGFYYYRYILANGELNLDNDKCRVNSNMKVVRILPEFYAVEDSICSGLGFAVGDKIYTEAGTYTDTLISFFGCDSVMTLSLVTVDDPGIIAELNYQDPLCSYSNDGFIILDTITNGNGPFEVLNGSDTITDQPYLYNLTSGDYPIKITDRFGCYFEDTINLIRPDSFMLDIGEDIAVELGEGINFSVQTNQPVANYVWTPAGIIDCTEDCDDLSFSIPYSTPLHLLVNSEDGCVARDSIFISVDPVRKVFFPNVISPNGDGVNDFFAVYGSAPNVQGVVNLKVYDRWGGLLYENQKVELNAENTGWNGRDGFQQINSGTYMYSADILFLDGAIINYSGSFSVVR